jgi:hypothetical protein
MNHSMRILNDDNYENDSQICEISELVNLLETPEKLNFEGNFLLLDTKIFYLYSTDLWNINAFQKLYLSYFSYNVSITLIDSKSDVPK